MCLVVTGLSRSKHICTISGLLLFSFLFWQRALHTCTERIIRAHEDLLALYAQADQLKASSVIDLRCFAYSLTISLEVAFYFVTIIASLLSYRCSLLKQLAYQLLRFALLRSFRPRN